MIKKLYAENYPDRRKETFIRAAGRCENLVNGERCTTKLGDWRITHSGQLQFEQLICHHSNNDPENPEAELLIICWSCHMRLHRRPGPGRPKASARKRGYEVVRVQYLLEQLRVSGFHTWTTLDGITGWSIGDLTGQTQNVIDALAAALHWLSGEVRDLQSQIRHIQEKQTHASSKEAEKELIHG